MSFQFSESHFWITLVLIACALGAIQGTCAYLTFLERKISAWIQDRIGPNRAGREFGLPLGLVQPLADGLKFLFKEQVIPKHVDKLFYLMGPCVAVATALLAFAVVPFGRTTAAPVLEDRRTPWMVEASAKPFDADAEKALKEKAGFDKSRGVVWPKTKSELAHVLAADVAYAEANKDKGVEPYEKRLEDYHATTQFVIAPRLDVGIVWVFAVGSLAVYSIVLGGWSSNNKYSLMGALRSSAQLISYEIPLGMAVLGVFVLAGSLNLEKIIEQQQRDGWNVFFQPLACLLFLTSVFAETNRVPFDLPECEQELVAGYHTEYSGMKFAMFMLGEYTHMITTSLVMVVVFFGGWTLPFVPVIADPWTAAVVNLVVIAGKMGLFLFFYMFIRWTIPRFRFDQLMSLAWKVMMPLALVNLVAVVALRHYRPLMIDGKDHSHWLMLPVSLGLLVVMGAIGLRTPHASQKAKVIVRGHPITGGNQVIVG